MRRMSSTGLLARRERTSHAGLQILSIFGAAVIVALVWMVVAMAGRYATRRPVSGLLLLTLGILTIETVFTLATGNTFVFFVQPVFSDFAVAAIFLGSLWTAQPVIARLAPDFYPMRASVAARPEMRALFRRLTLMWGLVILGKGGITLWLLESPVDGQRRADQGGRDHHADVDRSCRDRRVVCRGGSPAGFTPAQVTAPPRLGV